MTKSLGEETLSLQIRALKLPEPVREYRFCSRRWRFDFAWVGMNLAVEVEGGTNHKSRHTSADGYKRDCEKYNEAALHGWTVLRFTTQMITSGEALTYIERALEGQHD